MGYRNYSVGNGYTVDKLGNGDFTTISAAIAASVSGDTIYVRTGVYTENIVLIPGISVTASTPATNTGSVTTQVTLSGSVTFSNSGSAGVASISNFLISYTGNLINVGGSAGTTLLLENCTLNAASNLATLIVFSNSASSSNLNLINCQGILTSSGSTLFTHTSAGSLYFFGCNFGGNGSSTASTISSGSLSVQQTIISNGITSSGTASVAIGNGSFINNAANNTTCVTCGGSGAHTLALSSYASGTASAISVSNTTTISLISVNSSNTNAITGSGTIINGGVSLIGTSQLINTTTQTPVAFSVGGITFDGGTDVLQNYVNAGTYVPTVVGASTTGTTTYVIHNGYYLRIGGLVYIEAFIDISAATGTGNATFNIPFTLRNVTTGTANGTVGTSGGATWTYPATTTYLILQAAANTATAVITAGGTTAASSALQMANAIQAFNYSINIEV
jgi:hypothetical protein